MLWLHRVLLISLCFAANAEDDYYDDDYDYYDYDDGFCSVKGMDLEYPYYPYTNKKIVDEGYVGVVEEFETRNVVGAYFDDPKYLDLKFDPISNNLLIFTTENFAEYEKNLETATTLKQTLHVNCSDGKHAETYEVKYQQNIRDLNKHVPKLNGDKYIYKFYTSLKRDFDLTQLVAISARDDDFSTSWIDFIVNDNDAVKCGTQSFKNKTGQAYLRTTRRIEPPFELNLLINATDRSNDDDAKRLNSSTTLQIILEKPNNPIIFKGGPFEGKIFERKYVIHDPIHLDNGIDPNTLVTIESAYSEWFDYSFDYVTQSIIFELDDTLPRPRNTHNVLDLNITVNQYGATTKSSLQLVSDEDVGYLCRLGGVDLDDSYNWDYKNPKLYPDVYSDEPVEVFEPLLNIQGVSCNHTYLDCVYEEDRLTIKMKEDFKYFEEREVGTTMKTELTVVCPYRNVSLKYRVDIFDNNTYAPTFDRKEYKYVLYDQVPKETELHKMVPIFVKDLDVSNNGFEISVNGTRDNEHFELRVSRPENKKSEVYLYNKRALDPGFETTVDIIVKDSGKPQRNSSAALTVKVLRNSKLEFTRSDYYAILRDGRLEFIGEAPGIVGGFDNWLKLTTRSEFLDVFDVQGSLEKAAIEVEVKDGGATMDELETRIRVDATWRGLSARSVVHITKNDSFVTTTTSKSTSWESTEDSSETWETTTSAMEDNFEEFHSWLYASTVSNIIIMCFALLGLVAMLLMARFYVLPHRRITVDPIVEDGRFTVDSIVKNAKF